MSKISKTQFLADMNKGYESIGYASRMYWGGNGDYYGLGTLINVTDRSEVTCGCAIGAAAYGSGSSPHMYAHRLGLYNAGVITKVSDAAGNKEKAIEAVTRAVDGMMTW